MIARTESTGALNAGHEAAREERYEEGLITGREWLTICDRHVRSAHQTLHGVQAGPKELLDVGGTLAPCPGQWSLPVSGQSAAAARRSACSRARSRRIKFAVRQGILKSLNSGVSHVRSVQTKDLKLSQPFEMYQPGIRHLGFFQI